MKRVFTRLGACTALLLAVVVVSCDDSPMNVVDQKATPTAPEAPTPAAPETLPFLAYIPGDQTQDNCIEDVVEFYDGSNSVPLNCTAKDVRLAIVVLGGGNPEECIEGDPVTINNLQGQLIAGSAERYDIGIWVALDGGNARGGHCYRDFLDGTRDGILPNNSPTCDNGPYDPDNGPWFNAECEEDADDTCGDLEQGVQNILDIGSQTFVCQDDFSVDARGNIVPGPDGFLDVGSCVSWDNVKSAGTTNKASCEELDDARPNTKAKCNCDPLLIPIEVKKRAFIEVVKDLVPDSDAGRFDLFIRELDDTPVVDDDGDGQADDVGDGGSTGTTQVTAGTQQNPGASYKVGEEAGTPNPGLNNYDIAYSCVEDVNGQTAVTGTGPDPVQLDVQPDDNWICTFTNTRKGKIIVVKNTQGGDGTFSFTSNTLTPGAFDLTTVSNTKNREFDLLSPGTYDVAETDPSPAFDLVSATCDDGSPPSAIDLDPGETVTCTFLNRERGTIIIKKLTDPVGGTGFGFTDDIESPNSFSLDHDQTKTFNNVVTGVPGAEYTVTEDDPTPEFDLTAISCDDGGSATPSTWVLATRTATVKLDPGETVTCTFTNTERGMAQVTKTVSGGPPGGETFDFEIRQGATPWDAGVPSQGTLIATATTDPVTGLADFSCAVGVSVDICENDAGGDAKIVPGSYEVCEIGMMPGWHSTLSDEPGAFIPPSGIPANDPDNSNVCAPFTLDKGETENFVVDNTPPPGGDARTIGFWKNWTSCDGHGNQDDVLDQTLASAGGILIGDVVVDECYEAVSLLDKREIKRNLRGKKKANDACYGLAAQLLAALLNFEAGAGACAAATTAATDGQALLDRNSFVGTGVCLPNSSSNPDKALARELARTLDMYNNNELCSP